MKKKNIIIICLLVIVISSFTFFYINKNVYQVIEKKEWKQEFQLEQDSFSKLVSNAFSLNENYFDNDTMNYLVEWYEIYYPKYNQIKNNFSMAEREYFIGKVTKNQSRKCGSIPYYELAFNETENKNLLYEILFFVSLECDQLNDNLTTNRWSSYVLNISNKNEFYRKLISGDSFEIKPRRIENDNIKIPNNISKLILGKSHIIVKNDTVIGVQIERIVRDWMSNRLNVYPDNKEDTLLFGEGKSVEKLLNVTNSKIIPLSGTIIIKSMNKWYAMNNNGTFSFEVLPDKANYPTNKCYGNICLILDTHGFSSITKQAIENNVDMVIACGDYYDKMSAAQYLAEINIDTYFPADRFIGDAIYHKGNGTMIGTAPIRNGVIGNQSIEIDINELIIVQDNDENYPGQYYDAPQYYFKQLENYFDLNTKYVMTNSNQTSIIVDKALDQNAKVIAVRVWTESDYDSVKKWLNLDTNNRAILFHSGLYPYSDLLFDEFKNQTSFGDTKPIFE